jgi:hypothetical protein
LQNAAVRHRDIDRCEPWIIDPTQRPTRRYDCGEHGVCNMDV